MNKDAFEKVYCDVSKSISSIASELQISKAMVYYYGKKFNLKREKIYHNPEWLQKKYIEENLSMREIGELVGKGKDVIGLLLKKYDITKSNEDIVLRRRATMQDRYGGPTPLESDILLEKINKTKVEKYGTINTSSLNAVKFKLPKTVNIYGKPANYWSKKYGVPRTNVLSLFRANLNENENEKNFINLLNNYSPKITDIENIFSTKFGLDIHNRYFDLENYPNLKYKPDFVLSKKIALNVDGLYWHSEHNSVHKRYHFKMREDYEREGLRIFQFREDEIKNKFEIVKSIINNALNEIKEKIYARKTEIRKVSNNDAKDFLNKNHLMGCISSNHIGLFYNNTLVSIMSYKIRNKKLKVDRFCSKINTVVVGGFSKLLKELKKMDIFHIDYWVDLRYGTGNHMLNKGFLFEKETLGWKWTDFRNTYNRLRCRANMDKRNLSQKEYAEELGWVKIYDAGQRLYRWYK